MARGLMDRCESVIVVEAGVGAGLIGCTDIIFVIHGVTLEEAVQALYGVFPHGGFTPWRPAGRFPLPAAGCLLPGPQDAPKRSAPSLSTPGFCHACHRLLELLPAVAKRPWKRHQPLKVNERLDFVGAFLNAADPVVISASPPLGLLKIGHASCHKLAGIQSGSPGCQTSQP
jgi:hypothetical protein